MAIRVFKHDMACLSRTVQALLDRNELGKAKELLEQIDLVIQGKSSKRYASHLLVDTVLREAAAVCEASHIRFSAEVQAPMNGIISDLSLVRLFSNLVNNAIEASKKVPQADRFIKLEGHQENEWLTILISNRYGADQVVKCPQHLFATTKPDRTQHGFGLTIIRDIVTDAGGCMLVDTDEQEHVFHVRIHIPLPQAHAAQRDAAV